MTEPNLTPEVESSEASKVDPISAPTWIGDPTAEARLSFEKTLFVSVLGQLAMRGIPPAEAAAIAKAYATHGADAYF